MRSEYMESEPPSFVKIQKIISSANSSRSYRFEILLPQRVAERINLDENIRHDKVAQALPDKKPEEAARQAEVPPSAMQKPKIEKAQPEAAVPAKTLVPGVDYDPQREHQIHASKETADALERAKFART